MEELGFDFIIVEPLTDESSDHPDPRLRAINNAEAKAKSVSGRYPDSLIIGADTIVYLDGIFMGKPSNPADAEKMLEMLSGKTHQVYTGIAVLNSSTGKMLSGVSRTDVLFKRLDSEAIRAYVSSGEPMDKAGAYAIQRQGESFIREISGSRSNVIGLPIELLEKLLRKASATYSRC